jgi:hypothetical protein
VSKPSLLALIGRRWRQMLLAGAALMALLLTWTVAGAQAPAGDPATAQRQLVQLLPAFRDSEAEQAAGAYIPGVGAMIALDLLRGPNTFKDKPADAGVRDWAIYLMGAFGPKLSAVPPEETIAISVSYYDFTSRNYRQLVITSAAASVADGATYRIWLDGHRFGGAADPAPPLVAGSAGLTLDFADPQAGAWSNLGGQWAFADQAYTQTELGRYDLISLLGQPVEGGYSVQVDLRRLDGDMGGGLVFNAPDPASKNGAHMVSYSQKGDYLQWGRYDEAGVFQFTGGSAVPSGADGKWHTLAVSVSGATYSVSLDGTALVSDVPLVGPAGGRVGLLVSTSQVAFDNLKLETK